MPLFCFLGSIKVAVPILLVIAAVLGWGTFYEARYGTAAVQRFVYQSIWFQGLLGFLAVNLALAAFGRTPWKRRHIPFLLAHLGIILVLAGGVIGGRWGVEGKLILPEFQESRTLQLPYNILLVHQPNPGIHFEFPIHFEAAAWNHHPHAIFEVPLSGRSLRMVVDRYHPDARLREEISGEGEKENPAIRLILSREGQEEELWLFGRDPDRFGVRFGRSHIFFLAPASAQQMRELLHPTTAGFRWPPGSLVLLREPQGGLFALLIAQSGRKHRIDPVRVGFSYSHPWLDVQFRVADHVPRARLASHYVNQSNEVRAEAIHLTVQDGDSVHEGWLPVRGSMTLPVTGKHPVLVEYRPAERELPVWVKLFDFRKIDYPGTDMAAGFESDVEVKDPEKGVTFRRTIRMNNPLKYRGYTFFQASYIPGPTEATVLAVRKDPGVPLVYTGFIVIVLGVVTLFLQRSRGRVAPWLSSFLLAFLFSSFAAQASAQETPGLSQEAKKLLRPVAVLHNGRIKPLDSFARENLRHITGAATVGREDPLDTLFSIMSGSKNWQQTAIIQVPFIPLRLSLGLSSKTTHVSYDELVATRRLMRMLPAIVEKQQQDEKLSMLEQETMDLYDRFVGFHNLLEQKLTLAQEAPSVRPAWEALMRSLPQGADASTAAVAADGSRTTSVSLVAARRLVDLLRKENPGTPAWRLQWEVIYNQTAPFRWARWIYLAACVGFLLAMTRGMKSGAGVGSGALWAAFLIHAAGILSRVVLGGRPPVSNFYETMLWLPFVGVVLSFVLSRIYRVAYFGFAASLLAAVTLWIADFSPLDSSITPVVAVLRSHLWLTIHVLTMVGSYAPIALAVILAHICAVIYLRKGFAQASALELFIYRALQVGVVLLASGIMLGAVWANASWGRYWGWDPKETWALITLLWFLAVLHGRFAGWLKGPGFALAVMGGFLPLLMTYYGVSFYLVGLHSYAGGHAKPLPLLLVAYLAAEAAFMAVIGYAAFHRRQPV